MDIFNGLKIVDLTRVFSGPFATRHFSDFGAEVIKIEPPTGDDTRHFPPLVGEWSGYYNLLNRGKKSLFLDLKNQPDLERLYKLCKDADVFVENFSPEVKNKLKVDYQTIKKINPKIIYASVNGISNNVDRKYYDVIAQAESGLVSLNGEENDMKVSTSIVDAFSGVKLAFAISSALYYKTRHNKGLSISVSMKGSAFDLLEQNLIEASITGNNPPKVGNYDNAVSPFGIYKTSDGSLALACGNDKFWKLLSEFLEKYATVDKGLYDTNDKRVKNHATLKTLIESVFSKHRTQELKKELDFIGVPCGVVNKMSDVLADRENYEQGLLTATVDPIAGKIVMPSGGVFFEDK